MGVVIDGRRSASLVESKLRASIIRLVTEGLRDSASGGAAPVLRIIRDALHADTLDVALRHLDRAWRSHPEEAPRLAPLYGRVLLLEASDYDAALHLLRRAAESAPDPDGAALIVWALFNSQRIDLARDALATALANYAVSPGNLLFQIAGAFTDLIGDIPGWIGRAPDLSLVGELSTDGPSPAIQTKSTIDIEIDGETVLSPTTYAVPNEGRRLFSVERARDAGETLEARVRGVPLLGSGARVPANFALDGRVENRDGRLIGWARLGWAPSQPVRIAVEDEQGRRATTRTRAATLYGSGRPFEFDMKAAGLGNRLSVSAKLPCGRWQPLPDSPLLLEAPISERRGKRQHLRPWGIDPVRTSARKVAPERAPIEIIIPVYRNREASLACIDAALDTAESATLVVVDDATDDAALAAALDMLAAEGRITLLRNPENVGFVVSVNRGLALHPDHDAVLLNADTLVYGDWLMRLKEAAYSGPDVGTVTPLSNNGSIASYPQAQGSVIEPDQGAALHALAASTNNQVRVPIPVGVGFCLYVRRDCLKDVGILDAETFDKGYGEETDFCVRARRRGWSHLLAADVFVYHAGGLSFGDRRVALLERSQRLINLRHAGFDRLIAQFLAADPLQGVRRRLDERRLQAVDGRFVLLVTLALTGGVDRFVTERCRAIRDQGLFPLLLKPTAAGDPSRCELSTEALDVPNLRYEIPSDLSDIGALLRSLPIAGIEIQHFLHLDPHVIEMVRSLPVPYDVVVHDYAWLCPRITLIDGSGRFCGEPALAACERCVRRHGSLLGEALTVAELRGRSEIWLRGARRVIAPSLDTASRLRRHFPEVTIEVQPHSGVLSVSPLRAAQLPRSSTRELVRVAVIGAIGEHKGYRVLLECAENARDRGLAIEFVVIGYTENDAPLLATGKAFVTGRYSEAEVPHLLRREQPDVIWLPSVWPETYCYTLDHALESGLPVVAFDIGAIAERLRAARHGELFSLDSDSPLLNDELLRIAAAAKTSHITASRSQHLTLAPLSDAATMDLTKPPGLNMTNPSEVTAAEPAQDAGLSASVQVLQLNFGLYLFSVTATGLPASAGGQLQLPAMQVGLGPGVLANQVEFMNGPATQGAWLFAATDQLVVKVHGAGATLILTSVRAPSGEALSIKIERLNGRSELTPLTADASPGPVDVLDPTLPVHVAAHIRTRGDMNFRAAPWAGRVAPGLWIESFSLHPLDPLSDQDLEYKGLTGSGHETPWITDNQPCGTRGMADPLVGFALRFKPSPTTAAYDCEYSAYFQSGLTVGPLRNGAPCRSTVANDPLEGLQVRLVKRAVAPIAAAPKLDIAPPAEPEAAPRAATAASGPRRSGRAAQRQAQRGP